MLEQIPKYLNLIKYVKPENIDLIKMKLPHWIEYRTNLETDLKIALETEDAEKYYLLTYFLNLDNENINDELFDQVNLRNPEHMENLNEQFNYYEGLVKKLVNETSFLKDIKGFSFNQYNGSTLNFYNQCFKKNKDLEFGIHMASSNGVFDELFAFWNLRESLENTYTYDLLRRKIVHLNNLANSMPKNTEYSDLLNQLTKYISTTIKEDIHEFFSTLSNDEIHKKVNSPHSELISFNHFDSRKSPQGAFYAWINASINHAYKVSEFNKLEDEIKEQFRKVEVFNKSTFKQRTNLVSNESKNKLIENLLNPNLSYLSDLQKGFEQGRVARNFKTYTNPLMR